MTSWWKRVRRAAGAAVETFDEGRFQVRGKPVVCPVCDGELFVRVRESRRVSKPLFHQLNIPWLKLDRLSTGLICTHCTHLMSFGRAPEKVEGGRRERRVTPP